MSQDDREGVLEFWNFYEVIIRGIYAIPKSFFLKGHKVRKSFLLFVFVFVAWVNPIIAGVTLDTSWQKDGSSWSWYVSSDELKRTPSWNGNPSDLPLSMMEAVTLSKTYLEKRHSQMEPLVLESIYFMRIDDGPVKDKWCYICQFSNSRRDHRTDPQLRTHVLLDKRIVEPTKPEKK